jgi:threonine dehydrogenase-like Zn-dependent dehydrogenase
MISKYLAFTNARDRTMAVCKALGARRILAVDVQENRLKFAKDYAATDIHQAIPKLPGEDQMAYSKRHVSHYLLSLRLSG